MYSVAAPMHAEANVDDDAAAPNVSDVDLSAMTVDIVDPSALDFPALTVDTVDPSAFCVADDVAAPAISDIDVSAMMVDIVDPLAVGVFDTPSGSGT